MLRSQTESGGLVSVNARRHSRPNTYESNQTLTQHRFSEWIGEDATRGWYVLIGTTFAVLVLLGITTSSIGISALRFDPSSNPGVLWGDPLPIRSDEWARVTPVRLGIMETGDDAFVTPLTTGPGLLTGLQDGLAAPFVYFDTTIARLGTFLPNAQLFAFLWWLPFWITAVSVAYILRFLGLQPSVAIGTTALALLSPTMSWWSVVAPFNIALATGCAALMTVAYNQLRRPPSRWRVPSAVLALVGAGVLLARMPLGYPPWSIPLGLVVVVPMAISLMWAKERAVGIIVVGVTLAIGVALAAGVFLANSEAYASLADTLYPGQRRTGGGGVSMAYYLSASFVGPYNANGLEVTGLNQSELATGFNLFAVAVLVYAAGIRARLPRELRPFVITSAIAVGALSAWVLLPWPPSSDQLPILSLLPPIRIAQVLGLGSILLFGVVLGAIIGQQNRPRHFDAVAATGTAIVLVLVGLSLRSTY
ncbi:MAG: hypothetical protein DWP92_10555, partial [Armatimonadetes bacterium]